MKSEVDISLGNGSVPSGNKPLPDKMLIKLYLAIKHHQVTRGWCA